jgi:gas vesicle protein
MSDHLVAQEQESGSFVMGFAVGLFAGAAGYYLFATDKGHKIRQELVKEWEQAKAEWPDLMGSDSKTHTWRDLIRTMVAQVVPEESEKKSVGRRVATAQKTAKFKGVDA